MSNCFLLYRIKLEIANETPLQGLKQSIHSVGFDDFDEELVLKATVKTKGACRPSCLDADNWRRILTLHLSGSLSVESFAIFLKKVFVLKIYIFLRLGLTTD